MNSDPSSTVLTVPPQSGRVPQLPVPQQCPSRRPVVCQLLHSLSVGGAEVLAARIARRLSEDYAMQFVCLDGLGTLGEELLRDGFTVHVLNRGSGVDLR